MKSFGKARTFVTVLGIAASVVLGGTISDVAASGTSATAVLPPATPDYGTTISAIRGTTWHVARFTENGRTQTVPADAMVSFDGGEALGSSTMMLFNGCGTVYRNVEILRGQLRNDVPAGMDWLMPLSMLGFCDPIAFRLTELFGANATVTPAKPTAKTLKLVVARGRRRVELTRTTSDLAGTGWVLDGLATIPPRGLPSITFGPAASNASDGCNRVDGRYLAINGRLFAGSARSTLVACPDPDGLRARAWTPMIREARYHRSADVLTIQLEGRTSVYRRIGVTAPPPLEVPPVNATAPPASAAVTGRWKVDSLDGGRRGGEAITGTIEFQPDGTLRGETPCERFTGSWSQAALTMATAVTALVRTETACDPAARNDNLVLGAILAGGQLSVGRGDNRLQLWVTGTDMNSGIVLRPT